jgi:hypothetical protein
MGRCKCAVSFALAVLMQAYAASALWADETKEARLEPFTDLIFKALKTGDKDLLRKGAIGSASQNAKR